MSFSELDIAIVVVFLAGSILVGLFHGKENRNSSDYFLGSHQLPWVVSMLSIVATETSVLTFVSVPGLAYRGDWSFLQLPLGYIFGRMLVSILLLPLYFKEGISSIYEIIGKRFGRNMQRVAASTFLVTRILSDGVRFLATGVVVQAVTGWSLPVSIMLIGSVTLVYTISGGLKTVVWLDSFQFLLYILGGLITIVFILLHMEGSLVSHMERLHSAGKLNMLQFSSDWLTNPFSFWSAFCGGIFLSFASHGIDFMMVQRVLACRRLPEARKALITSGLFVFVQFVIFLLAGSLMYLFYQGVPMEKDREFATFIVSALPSGLRGLLVAGILSAAMSTIASSINAAASSTVTDLLGGHVSLTQSRIVSFVWAFILVFIALYFDESDRSIIVVGLEIASFTYGGLLGLFLLSRSTRPFRSPSLIVGFIASMLLVVYLKWIGLAWTFYIPLSSAINIGLVHAVERILSRTGD